MNRGVKLFLSAFILVLLFWGVNIFQKKLEDFLFWREMAENPQILAAIANQEALEEKLRSMKPLRNWQVEELKIEAKSAISVLLDNGGGKRVLFQKNSAKILPIASLTKLMTAYVVLENYELSQVVKIPREALGQDEDFGKFKIAESFTAESLLYSLLIESSNGAAIALAEVIGKAPFIDLMNLETKNILGFDSQNTFFVNPTGLDPKGTTDKINSSTAEDLVQLTIHLLKEKPLIWEILNLPDFDLYSADGVFHHKILNTNELLGRIPGIIGGKTGETNLAGGCFILVAESPNKKGFLINVILGSPDRFSEMEKLVDWLNSAYKW